MANLKPKEPLLALLLTFIVSGLGQIYSGKVIRGLTIIGINLVFLLVVFMMVPIYIVNPNRAFSMASIVFFVILEIIGIAWAIFVIVDAYRSAKTFNEANKLERKITKPKRIFLVAGIIVVIFILTIGGPVKAYIKRNIVEPYKFPSTSMEPTIQQQDLVLADKAVYRKFEPQRGDVVVFKYPLEPKKLFVKRLIAFAGETVEIKDKHVYINGKLCSDQKIKERYYYNGGEYGKANKPVTVPKDSYYVLGDNSLTSMDSRYWGFVPSTYVSGKIYRIYWPLDRSGKVE